MLCSADRICVLDAGRIAEFDTPENLFARRDSIFRSMAERSSITADDIRLAKREFLGMPAPTPSEDTTPAVTAA
jgi:ABC-type proline/glycine betaine transport system ATPase subunit